MLITIDTNLMIWGIRQIASAGQEYRIEPAIRFLELLDEKHDTLALTSQSLSEYLTGNNDRSARDAELVTLTEQYIILPYDTRAAKIAADLRSDRDFISQLSEDEKRSKICIKSDIVIVATALAHGVKRIYTEDAGVKKIAKKAKLSAMSIPDEFFQRDLMDDTR